jgi:hypothetical protein
MTEAELKERIRKTEERESANFKKMLNDIDDRVFKELTKAD